jgi:hypothetical protein
MLKTLYNWMLRLGASRRAPAAMVGISFAESSFFPSPPDVMLAPMVLEEPRRACSYVTICAGCVGPGQAPEPLQRPDPPHFGSASEAHRDCDRHRPWGRACCGQMALLNRGHIR